MKEIFESLSIFKERRVAARNKIGHKTEGNPLNLRGILEISRAQSFNFQLIFRRQKFQQLFNRLSIDVIYQQET